MRVLVVDDEVRLATGLARCLRHEGFAVDVAHDGGGFGLGPAGDEAGPGIGATGALAAHMIGRAA